jgi:hypothetical protein
MYPRGELEELAARKAVLQARIAIRRYECIVAAAELKKPLAFADRVVGTWRSISPMLKLVSVPLGLLLAQFAAKRFGKGKLTGLIAAFPAILRGVRIVMDARKSAHAAAGGSTGAR